MDTESDPSPPRDLPRWIARPTRWSPLLASIIMTGLFAVLATTGSGMTARAVGLLIIATLGAGALAYREQKLVQAYPEVLNLSPKLPFFHAASVGYAVVLTLVAALLALS